MMLSYFQPSYHASGRALPPTEVEHTRAYQERWFYSRTKWVLQLNRDSPNMNGGQGNLKAEVRQLNSNV
jgi:hypothetical protein